MDGLEKQEVGVQVTNWLRELVPRGVETRGQVMDNLQRWNQQSWQVEWMLHCKRREQKA